MDELRERIRERLNALQINPFEAARRANFERSFVNDLLIGKKTTIRSGKLPALAEALECDADFLRGKQAVARAGDALFGGQPISGICEAGVWREPGADLPARPVPYTPDPRYPAKDQALYLVRGDHAAGFGITDGSVIVAIHSLQPREGDFVVIQRSRKSGEVETTARLLAGGALSASPPVGQSLIAPVDPGQAQILGVIAVSFRVFG